MFYTFFSNSSTKHILLYINKLYYSALLSWLNPKTEKQPMTDHFLYQNHALQTCGFCFTALSYQKKFFYYFWKWRNKVFTHSRIIKDHDPNSNTFLELEIFSPNSRTFQDFQGLWKPWIHNVPYILENWATIQTMET